MKRPPDPERDALRQQAQPKDEDAEEREIDQILADSFPASDAPPWTLGVKEPPQKGVRKRKGRRG